MDASIDVVCGICEAQHITKCAEHWCPECEEGLCSDCQRHHSISRATRRHEIISVENYKKLPPFISNIIQHCTEHNSKYQHYCQQHDQMCCPVCVSVNHKKCEDLLAIQAIIASSKSSALFDNMKQTIDDMKINIDKLIQDRKQNLTKIQEQRHNFFQQIKQEREKINSHLDTLEHRVTTELNTTEQKIKAELEELLKRLVNKREVIEELGVNLKSVEDYASDLQTFLGSKAIEKEVEKEAAQIKTLKSSGRLQKVDLRCIVNTEGSDVLCNVSSIGSVSVQKSPSSVVLKQNEQQAQIMLPVHNRPTSNITLKLKSELIVQAVGRGNLLRGCIVCPDGEIVLADAENKRIVVLNTNGTTDREVSVPQPYDLTLVDDTTIAITTDTGIQIINFKTKKTEDRFPTAGQYCYGITFSKGQLIYCHAYKGIEIMNIATRKVSYLHHRALESHWTNVTSFADNIYYSNHAYNTVTAYKPTGEIIWKFKDENILKNPRFLTTDNNGNVYVASSYTNNIIVISPDGKFAKPLLTSEDGNKDIAGVFFDKKRNVLLRMQSNGLVYMYNV